MVTNKTTEFSGTFKREFIRFESSNGGPGTAIANLEDGTTIKGDWEPGELTTGVAYRFFGKWVEHHKYGKQFIAEQWLYKSPATRNAVVAYLKKNCHGIGNSIGHRIYDIYREKSVAELRNNPIEVAAQTSGLSVTKAKAASEHLKEIQQFEETQIELGSLLEGRGFSRQTAKQAIKKWGIHAPGIIKRNPFALIVERFPSAGFARCDRLYLDMGHKPERPKRLMLCLWHMMKTDSNGHTWFATTQVVTQLQESVSVVGFNIDQLIQRAIDLGVRANWLAMRKDTAGQIWITERQRAEQEILIVNVIKGLTE